jgi:hypothetical protein
VTRRDVVVRPLISCVAGVTLAVWRLAPRDHDPVVGLVGMPAGVVSA